MYVAMYTTLQFKISPTPTQQPASYSAGKILEVLDQMNENTSKEKRREPVFIHDKETGDVTVNRKYAEQVCLIKWHVVQSSK